VQRKQLSTKASNNNNAKLTTPENLVSFRYSSYLKHIQKNTPKTKNTHQLSLCDNYIAVTIKYENVLPLLI